ncbi:MAG: Unknown protein [uncultured Sulfurovum sp.]|uniref:Uncharacterized protein n=1 Tax=uncultured Sulfurovum sp. TaxID=269237 RepID=A0A6S6TMC1_9BACT|nr:MAG: Unknown protein [uncultured Sulfurovum sp.]
MNYIYIFITYVLLVSLVTTYRLMHDDFYNIKQKIIQLFIIWLLPLVGSAIVAWFLNENSSEPEGIWKKYPKISNLLGKIFFIEVKKNHFKKNVYSTHDSAQSEGVGGD